MKMMLHMAIGDAYGAGREYADPKVVADNNDGKTYVQHQKWKDLTPGRYTDDTQMAIALAEYLLQDGEYNTSDLACKFVEVFKRDQRAGYAGGFYKLLQEVQNGYELVDRISPMSDKSGGAMRAAPCGLLPTLKDVCNVAAWQASVTHATVDGMNAAVGAALMVFLNRHSGVAFDQWQTGFPLLMGMVCPFKFDWDTPWEGPVGAKGLDSVHAAFTSIVGSNGTLSDILKRAIAWTGDVDTVAAIAMAAASVNPAIVDDLPEELYRNLEGGKYGWRYLKALDAKLEKAFPLPKAPAKKPEESIVDLFGG